MHRADACAGEHRHRRLRHHRHVDDHPVALLHPLRAQGASQARHFVAQLRIGEALLAAGHRRVVDQGSLLAAAQFDLPVESEVAGVQPAIGEPAMAAIRKGFERGLRGAVPVHRCGLFGPEAGGVRDGTVVALPVIHYLTLGNCFYREVEQRVWTGQASPPSAFGIPWSGADSALPAPEDRARLPVAGQHRPGQRSARQ
ncbi:hypothetical protein D3C78_1370560 [compost metagenome]